MLDQNRNTVYTIHMISVEGACIAIVGIDGRNVIEHGFNDVEGRHGILNRIKRDVFRIIIDKHADYRFDNGITFNVIEYDTVRK
jgi:hypothetical protein